MAPRLLRIGELARRTGVSADVLRAWERRYGLLRPVRSSGNYRLYSPADEARVAAMSAHLAAGVAAGEAARLVMSEEEGTSTGDFASASRELARALEGFDDAGAQAALDGLLAAFGLETVAREVILPYLRGLGERWERGEASVAQEHFASVVLRGRLLGLARGWDRGSGPRALLACAPGEQHELGLIVFGLALRAHGWRITYLGADTPFETLHAAAGALHPDAVVVTALRPGRAGAEPPGLDAVGHEAPLWLAGAGFDAAAAARSGGKLLRGDPVAAAAMLADARS